MPCSFFFPLNHAAEELGAITGGAGFGVFIDELGKFITNDNDYFFQPAIAVIYVIFVLLYMTIRLINRSRKLSPKEDSNKLSPHRHFPVRRPEYEVGMKSMI